MSSSIVALLTLVAHLVAGSQGEEHQAVLKSLRSAERECSAYLPYNSVCATRCRELVTRSWNSTLELPAVYANRFYQPDESDQCYLQRTESCLRVVDASIPRDNPCQRVNQSVQCYADHYGQLIADHPKYVRLTTYQLRQIMLDCSRILNIPLTALNRLGSPDSNCLLRCYMIRQGVYHDDTGPNMERLYVQCGGYADPEQFSSDAVRCFEELKATKLDRCELAYRVASECVNIEGAILGPAVELAIVVLALAFNG